MLKPYIQLIKEILNAALGHTLYSPRNFIFDGNTNNMVSILKHHILN